MNQKIKVLNIVCHGSNYQLMLPFHQAETSEVLRSLFARYWVRIFGPPKVIVMDPAQTNLGEPFQQYLDSQGIKAKPTAAEAHWQLGPTERHGGWFARVLSRTIAEFSPSTKDDWEKCVLHAHVKNQMVQSYGYTAHQHVFGKNPRVPANLLDEPLRVVPATPSLTDSALARSQAIRLAAQRAVLEMQDDQSLRRALAACPRVTPSYVSGDLVG